MIQLCVSRSLILVVGDGIHPRPFELFELSTAKNTIEIIWGNVLLFSVSGKTPGYRVSSRWREIDEARVFWT